ncbi:MAG: hypothetical protein MI724_02220, partial [Spirochaetales bacterium]|nr:hypothetical protein [Spirochaetales bacterium]
VRRTIDELRFAGTHIPGADETSSEITRARIEYEGLIFEFSESDPVVITTENDSDAHLVPKRYEVDEHELRVFFSDESLLRFEVALMNPPELHLLPIPTNQWPEEGHLLLPYRFSSGVRSQPLNPATPETINVSYDDRDFFFSTPPRTIFDEGQDLLMIPLSGGSQMIRYAEITGAAANVVEVAFSEGRRGVSDSVYHQMIDEYLETGYRGWTRRFNGGTGTWQTREGGSRFSEEILTAYLAEAWERDEYTTAFNRMRRAADLHPDQVGLLSSVFLGDLRDVTEAFIADDRRRALTLSSRIAAGDPTVFREEDIIPFAALRGDEELYRDVIEFARVVDYRVVDIPTAIGMLASAVDTLHPSAEARDATERLIGVVEERILPSIRQFQDYFFVETAQGEVELYWSIRAGDLLEQLGQGDGNPLYTTIGRNLMMSGLELADEQGFLPEFLFFNENGLQGQEGSFGPERLYTHLSENPWYPRKMSLYEELGAGRFIWTIADFTRAEIGEEQFSFRLRYPENRTHYILMQGVPPFESMILFGLQWRNDPSFESYIKGRHYERDTNTLMIKYTDDSVEEDIILFY